MISPTILLAASALYAPFENVEALHANAVYQAIQDEIARGLEASRMQDIKLYMETIPADTRIVEEDGSITDRNTLRERKLKEWTIIPTTNTIEMLVTGFEIGCDGDCATVWTDQKWDRQMLGRDSKSEFNVITTQKHKEHWEVRDSRWVNVDTVELGGTTMIDGKSY